MNKNQLTRADVSRMSSAQINAAREDGRLNQLLSGATSEAPTTPTTPAPEPTATTSPGSYRTGEGASGVIGGPLSREQLKSMTHDEINAARSEGRFDNLLGR